MKYKALSKEELSSVIEGKSVASRVPAAIHFWVNPQAFGEQEKTVLDILESYPSDVQTVPFSMPDKFTAPEDDPGYRWSNFDVDVSEMATRAIDEQPVITDWDQLDGILSDFPSPYYSGLFRNNPLPDSRYRLGNWWYLLFERHWSLRGMSNALMDYYTDPDMVKRLFRALTDFYLVILERAKNELNIDGVFVSDDLGSQLDVMFSPEIFREFFKPYYKEIVDKAHALGMHFWLHSCGNIRKILPDLIDIGLDVLHPVQKYCMDEREVALEFGKDICIWAGMDVQQIIPWGTPDEVRQEVRHLIDTYYRPEGRLMITAGNAVNGDCPIESLEAFLDETYKYGTEIVA